MKKTLLTVAALVLVLATVLTGCGSEGGKVAKLKEGDALELTEWSMNATAWSSPNGATVNLTATPNGYLEGQSVEFVVRLEGEDIAAVPCQWDGQVYTASADLNAADGYCYYAVLTAANGAQTEVAVNTPNDPTDDSLIHMETALNAYCEASVSESSLSDGKLTVDGGSMKIQLPFLTLDTGAVTCQEAKLVLLHNGAEASEQSLTVPEAGSDGACVVDLSGIGFEVPGSIEDEHQLSLRLDVTLSNGHTLTAPAGVWYYMDGELLLAVG